MTIVSDHQKYFQIMIKTAIFCQQTKLSSKSRQLTDSSILVAMYVWIWKSRLYQTSQYVVYFGDVCRECHHADTFQTFVYNLDAYLV